MPENMTIGTESGISGWGLPTQIEKIRVCLVESDVDKRRVIHVVLQLILAEIVLDPLYLVHDILVLSRH